MSKREEQFDEWETMRQDAKRRQRDDRRLNLFWRKNKCFPAKFGREDEFPDAEQTLAFWRSIKNKEVRKGWQEDRDIRGGIQEVKLLQEKGSGCRWFACSEEEFDEVL